MTLLLGTGALPAAQAFAQSAGVGGADVRLMDGRPGAGYWQQQVDYSIEARLEPQTRRLAARGTITYHNRSPDPLPELHWHLYQNLFREDSPAHGRSQILGRRMVTTRGITMSRLELDGRPLVQEIDGTLMRTSLPEPLAPGDSLLLHIEWEYEVPPVPTIRTGSRGEDFGMAQWYPQIAVYDDQHGWNRTPYLGTGEFYLEYGDWEARITVPASYVVAATGTLRNPEQVLSSERLGRLRAAAAAPSGTVIPIVTREEVVRRAARGAEPERTWVFRARQVRDFAWAASPEFLWDVTRTAPLPLQPEGVWIHSFYRPDEARDYGAMAEVARAVIEYWSPRFGPYLYPQATVVSGPVEGMEYPMLAFGGPASRLENYPLHVVVHELGHQWYPMMLGTHETRYPAMDEGMTTFITSLALDHLYGPYTMWSPRMPLFLRGFLGRGHERRILQAMYLLDAGGPSDIRLLLHAHAMNELQLGLLVYVKTSSVLFMLRDLLGAETFERAMREYHERWRLKHPYPQDFFRTVEDVSGRDLAWFWQQWFASTATLDLALREVEQESRAGGWQARLTLANQREATLPATVRLTLRDGGVRELRVPESVWTEGAGSHIVEVAELPAAIRRVEIDPEHILADVNRSNNVWPAGAPSAAGPLLGMRWRGFLLLLLGAWLTLRSARVGGTLLAARRAGARVLRYGAGPLTLWSAERGVRPAWFGRRTAYGGGTIVLPEAAATPAELRRRLARVLAGAPLAALSLAGGAVLLLAGLDLAHRLGWRGESSFHLDAFAATVGLFALVGLAISLLPERSYGFIARSPWLRLQLFRGPGAERWSCTRALVAQSWAGKRPRDWDPEPVACATRMNDRSPAEAGACLLAYLHALDRGETAAAAGYLERAEQAVRGRGRRRLRRHVLVESAFFQAFYRGDAHAARGLLEDARGRGVPGHLRTRAGAALARAEGNLTEAERRAREALGRVPQLAARLGGGIAMLEEEWLRGILEPQPAVAGGAEVASVGGAAAPAPAEEQIGE